MALVRARIYLIIVVFTTAAAACSSASGSRTAHGPASSDTPTSTTPPSRGPGSPAPSTSGAPIPLDRGPRPASAASIKTPPIFRGDRKPFNAGAEYPAEARGRNIHGKILVRLVVNEYGRVSSQALVTGLGHGLDELAMKYAAKFEFEPARDLDDNPVVCAIIWKFDIASENDSQSTNVPANNSPGVSGSTTSTPAQVQ